MPPRCPCARRPRGAAANGRRPPAHPVLATALALLALSVPARTEARPGREPPAHLAETGLYADPGARRLAAGVRTWSPQYPLWSDGATKRRWILLPAGKSIDAADPDAWVFPVGTRLWKEFSFDGRRVETRYMERRGDGSWLFATYRWTEDGSDARLAPETGVAAAVRLAAGTTHDLPSRGDCEACHAAGRTPVLGFSALQLSPDRDPGAPHAEPLPDGAVDLPSVVRTGMVRRLPRALLAEPPRVRAAPPAARAALGYLHGNCGGCHDLRGELASLGLDLVQRLAPSSHTGTLATAAGVPSRYQPPGAARPMLRIAAGDPERSALLHRISSRAPADQMPPIGTHLVDEPGVRLVREWIAGLPRTAEPSARIER